MTALRLTGPVLAPVLASCGSSDDVRGPFRFRPTVLPAPCCRLKTPGSTCPGTRPRTGRTVLGVTVGGPVRRHQHRSVYGPSFSNYEVWEDGFEIISRDDLNYAPEDFVNPIGVTVNTEPEVIDPLGATADRQAQGRAAAASDPLPGATNARHRGA